MQRISKLALLVVTVLIPMTSQAQQEVEMADVMRSNGKIYVIVGIILIVLTGLFVYLFTVDRKLSKIERDLEKASKTK